jgi:hypothetical protein
MWARRIGWFAGLWAASVAGLGALSLLLKMLLRN